MGILAPSFTGIAHVEQFNLRGMPDREIRRFAREHDYCVVSKDSDYNQLTFLSGEPPQITWIRVPGSKTWQIATLLMKHKARIRKFMTQDDILVLELKD